MFIFCWCFSNRMHRTTYICIISWSVGTLFAYICVCVHSCFLYVFLWCVVVTSYVMLFFCSNAADVIVVVVIALWLPVMDIFFVDACNFFRVQHSNKHSHTRSQSHKTQTQRRKSRRKKNENSEMFRECFVAQNKYHRILPNRNTTKWGNKRNKSIKIYNE